MNLRTCFVVLACLALSALSLAAEPLRVCADPDYLPYSNREGAGFENRAAVAVAHALGDEVEYVWADQRAHGGFAQFLAKTLDAGKCDVVMSMPYGSRDELTTHPYYISSYVFVFDKSKNYNIENMDSPILKKVKVGFEIGTPVEDALKIRGLIQVSTPFDIGEDSSESPSSLLAALNTGKIDVLITWQPAIGAYLRSTPNLQVVPVPNERSLGVPEQYIFPMSMAVKSGNEALKKRLDEVIEKHQSELTAVLADNGVMSFTLSQGGQ